MFSLVLAFVLGLTVLLHDVSTSGCLAIAVVTGAYIIFTLALGLVSAVALLLGASTSTFVVFVLVWPVPTSLFVRLRRRNGRP